MTHRTPTTQGIAMTQAIDVSHEATAGERARARRPGRGGEPLRTRQEHAPVSGTTPRVDRTCPRRGGPPARHGVDTWPVSECALVDER